MCDIKHVDFYAGDWISGTASLTLEERGLYITACALIYDNGGPVDRDRLKRACGVHGRTFSAILGRLLDLGKLFEIGGKIGQKRAENELKKARNRLEKWLKNLDNTEKSATYADRAGGNARRNLPTTNYQEEERDPKGSWSNGPEPGRSTEPDTRAEEAEKAEAREVVPAGPSKAEIEGEFRETFWPECPRKVGKQEALRQYRIARRSVSLETLVDGIRRYAEIVAGTDPHFMVHPERWLSKHRWLDEEPVVKTWGYRNGRQSAHAAETAAFEYVTRQ